MIEADDSGADERLRRIEAVTDSALSRLDVDDLFDELLGRVRELLQVDTAAILLLDQHAQQLVATAAKGLEEEVRQGFRISVGRGFAGRIAQDRQPLIIDQVTPAEVVNPILHDKGIQSLLGVPMFAGSDLVGVLHVGSLTTRRFTPDDVRLLQLVADRASMASQVRLGTIDRTAALALQRSLLPTRLPEVGGVDMAARYLPGQQTGIGGDWYDVFTLPSGWLGIVVGDVSGHGLRAAVVMGRLRSALRAYSLECDDPADALTRLDQKVQHFEAGNLATVLYAMISPDRERIRISLAGHLPPMLARPDHGVDAPVLPVDLPLGVGRPKQRRSTDVEFPDGAVLVCYTDGLIERRDELIDVGFDRLRAAIRPGPAETVCATIMSTLGVDQPADDVALLTIRRRAAA
ncbi:PP2C family protein-serine/threonine phosphatase [Plantactinospora soyae]|uniref:Methionine-R-sulfoxide reductase with GAF domain n=1 Tax=Plantactinospora soyae TaxID=1544732 RepID=A0A927M3W8_9ACTN|nr:GAF domain-containing SpoIIE family protein phosphatase [Plantactinospora soyae]MBE1487582.1 putative methionine-R-sulfoxide reductase with GAF domain [Plantactinospora soyae]